MLCIHLLHWEVHSVLKTPVQLMPEAALGEMHPPTVRPSGETPSLLLTEEPRRQPRRWRRQRSGAACPPGLGGPACLPDGGHRAERTLTRPLKGPARPTTYGVCEHVETQPLKPRQTTLLLADAP